MHPIAFALLVHALITILRDEKIPNFFQNLKNDFQIFIFSKCFFIFEFFLEIFLIKFEFS